jgi:methionyl-tRNA formyltransferase
MIAVLGSKRTCLRMIAALPRVDLVVTILDDHDTRSVTTDIVQAGERAGARVIVVQKHTDAYLVLDEASPDVVFVAGWYWLIPNAVLDSVPGGFVGVHYSKLPKYRGSAPVVWAMINGESEVGFSVFRLSAGMDEGPLAAQGTVTVDADDSVADVLDRLDAASLDELARIAPAIEDGTLEFSPQDVRGASYAGVRQPADGRIDWSRPADEIARFVRAQSRPYPGAFTTFRGDHLTVWAAREDADARYFGSPGQVVRIVDGHPVVSAGGGTGLMLIEVESPGDIRYSLATTRFV